MKWRTSFDWKPKSEQIFGFAFLVGVTWCLTTFAFHMLLMALFALPADSGYRDQSEEMLAIYLLPLLTLVPLILVGAFFGIENCWQQGLIWRARLGYGATSIALLLWSWWSLRTNLSYGHGDYFHGYGVPVDTMAAAAYASICFPLAVACACVLLAIARRAPSNPSPNLDHLRRRGGHLSRMRRR